MGRPPAIFIMRMPRFLATTKPRYAQARLRARYAVAGLVLLWGGHAGRNFNTGRTCELAVVHLNTVTAIGIAHLDPQRHARYPWTRTGARCLGSSRYRRNKTRIHPPWWHSRSGPRWVQVGELGRGLPTRSAALRGVTALPGKHLPLLLQHFGHFHMHVRSVRRSFRRRSHPWVHSPRRERSRSRPCGLTPPFVGLPFPR